MFDCKVKDKIRVRNIILFHILFLMYQFYLFTDIESFLNNLLAFAPDVLVDDLA